MGLMEQLVLILLMENIKKLTLCGGSKFVGRRNEEVASMVTRNNDRKVLCSPLDRILFSEPQRLPLLSM